MDEKSWRARLAKSNINVINIDKENKILYLEFSYRSAPGRPPRWAKTFCHYRTPLYWTKAADEIREHILELRKELEA